MSFKISMLFILVIFSMFRLGISGIFRSSWTFPQECYMRSDSGYECYDEIKDQTRFYYNLSLDECIRFKYAGCGGNNNNFYTYKSCYFHCTDIIPSDARVPKYF